MIYQTLIKITILFSHLHYCKKYIPKMLGREGQKKIEIVIVFFMTLSCRQCILLPSLEKKLLVLNQEFKCQHENHSGLGSHFYFYPRGGGRIN